MEKTTPKRTLGVFALAMISVAGIFSLRSLPMMAEYGLGSIFFYVLAAIIFFLPSAAICAELATGWPKTGGVYIWVREAFGPRLGFLAIWMEWINTVVWFPAILSFMVATLAYAIQPSLAQNKIFMFTIMIVIFWGTTFINFFGMKVSSWLSSFGIVLGTLIPAAFIIILGFSWFYLGEPSQITFSAKALIPSFGLEKDVFFIGLILSFAGMQIAGFHAQETKNPQSDYPKAIFLATIIILFASILGTLAIAIVIPQPTISLLAGLMQTFSVFFDKFNMPWMLPILAILTVFGAFAALNSWIIGPSKGIYAMAKQGELPKFYNHINKYSVPTRVLLMQAIIGTILASVFLFMPTVTSSYWLLSALTAQLTMIMYLLLFSAVIKLRYSQPNVKRGYKVPGGKPGIWIIAGMAIITAFIVILLGFVPPAQLRIGNLIFYESFLLGGLIVLAGIPFLHIWRRKR